MSNERVSERTLERMTVGELSDEEARDVLRRLEEEDGGPDRLEELLAEREEFLRANPPEIVARQIIRKAREGRAEGSLSLEDAEDFRMINPQLTRNLTLAAAAAAAVALVVAGYFGLRPEKQTATQPAGEVASTEPAPQNEPPEGDRLVEVEKPNEAPPEGLRVVRWDGRSQTSTPLGAVVDGRRVLLLETGQIITMKTDGGQDLTVSSSGVAEVSGSETIAYLEGVEAGEAELVVRDGERRQVDVIVAEELGRTLVEERVVREHGRLDACFQGTDAGVVKVRFLVDAGEVTIAHPEFSDVEPRVEECVIDQVSGWHFEGVSGRKTGAYRFAADDAGLCEPGEDC